MNLSPQGTGVLRFDFQHASVAHSNGIVLNVGCNEDPAGLRERWGTKVINCDLEAWDSTMDRPNPIDMQFDATQFPWPFGDDYADVVILGDILEHFPFDVMVAVLNEARRVGKHVCITVPTDTRVDEKEMGEKYTPGSYNLHTIIVTEDVLRSALDASQWKPYIFFECGWGFNDDKGVEIQGFCVMAHRASDPVSS